MTQLRSLPVKQLKEEHGLENFVETGSGRGAGSGGSLLPAICAAQSRIRCLRVSEAWLHQLARRDFVPHRGRA